MSIDRRLREAFVGDDERANDLDVERHLRSAVTRAHRRELGRAAAASVLALVLVAAVFAAGAVMERGRVSRPLAPAPSVPVAAPAPSGAAVTAIDGRYETTVRTGDGVAAGLSRTDAFGIAGPMEVWFARDTVRVEQTLGSIAQIPVSGLLEVTAPRARITEGGEVLTLGWRRLPGGDLRFRIIDDTRTGDDALVQRVLWTSHDWRLASA